jgi:AcrR family transcriptional regulator
MSAERESAGDDYVVIWARPERAAKGPAPSRSRAEITAAAIALADAEGADAFTMRRVAAALGIGTASLYRYVQRKDELIALMMDAVEVEDGGPAPPTGDPAADLAAYAQRQRLLMLRHPWLTVLGAGMPSMGPNSLVGSEYALTAAVTATNSIDDAMLLTHTLDAFVRGYVLSEVAEDQFLRQSGLSREQWMAAHRPYLAAILTSGKYPTVMRAIMDARSPHASDPERQEFTEGLERVLHGLLARLPNKS